MAVFAVLVFAVVSATAAPEVPAPTSQSNKAAATSDAKTLLSRLILPAGSTPLAAEPSGDHGQLASPATRPVTPNLADAHGWWRVPEEFSATTSFLDSHPPSGSARAGRGAGSGPGYGVASITFGFPPVAGVLGQRALVVEAVPLPHGVTGIRADGQSVWITPRARSDRIPHAKLLRIKVVRVRKVLQGPFAVRSQAKIGAVVEFLDGLPAPQPGTYSCPADQGVRGILDFFATKRAKRPEAVATVIVGGCGGVQLSVHGHREQGFGNPPVPATGPYVSTEQRVGQIIGRKLKTG